MPAAAISPAPDGLFFRVNVVCSYVNLYFKGVSYSRDQRQAPAKLKLRKCLNLFDVDVPVRPVSAVQSPSKFLNKLIL